MSLLAAALGLTAGALGALGAGRLAEHRKDPAALSDLLGWGFLVGEGVVLMKDGSFMCSFAFRGRDLISSTPREVEAMTEHVATALASLGDGWMVHVDATRRPAVGYADRAACHFPDPVSALVDEVRRESYTAGEGSATAHYDTACTLHLTYTPPAAFLAALSGAVVKGRSSGDVGWDRALAQFERDAGAFRDRLSAVLRVRRLGSAELLAELHRALTTLSHPVTPPAVGAAYLDWALADQPFVGGFEPRIGDAHLRLVSVQGYPDGTLAGHGDPLTQLPFPYRYSVRYVALGAATAEARIKKAQHSWFQKRKGVTDWLQSMSNSAQGKAQELDPAQAAFQDRNAHRMLDDAAEARRLVASGGGRFGYLTCTVVVAASTPEAADDRAAAVLKTLRDAGLSARVEDVNAVQAFLGSLPGHGSQNLRRPMLSAGNAADLLPLTAPWGGPERVASPLFDADAPSLLWAQSDGTTPFRLCLHEGDVGHTLVVGATGAGKSVLVDALLAQWRRYRGAQTYVFDVGYSHFLLGLATGARHYDLSGPDAAPVELQPLRDVDRAEVRTWAVDWIETLVELQGARLSPTERQRVAHAVELLADNDPADRTLTALMVGLGTEDLRSLVRPYTVEGPYGRLLDGARDGVLDGRHQVFELSHIVSMSDRVLVPVLTHLFRRVEAQLTGAPTLIVIEEAWAALMRSLFADRLRQWLLTLRKRNASVVIVAHSPAQLRDPGLRGAHLLVESCPTRIFLPNPDAADAATAALYGSLGLNAAEVGVVAKAQKKRHYYFRSPSGARLFELDLSPAELAFLAAPSGMTGPEVRRTASALAAEYGAAWPEAWLRRLGLEAVAARLRELAARMDDPEAGAPTSGVGSASGTGIAPGSRVVPTSRLSPQTPPPARSVTTAPPGALP
ncbi:MAG: conjugal transfer protein TrbE [Bacteroidota bacterium]